ncbi:putative Ubiquitin-40S ribosomal protein S27a [Blattamonas nauphoetae]|uniref:Ubiquitin-40S ribosomal protein S27a n=1 Tax=Blattamonas nauphoetae TaxID=2049346 RepID=A0ABQ9XI09_9EUKA|nr:putative Ubiquitin-40S ribosomal protein S27a [Blattamonas nauphoetae]
MEVSEVIEYDILRLVGGGKKHKKKVYTKPKKNKHKKKKVKLAVLKYYNIRDDGTVVHARHECRNPACGAGVFMAKHKDRLYCGKCGATYINKQD